MRKKIIASLLALVCVAGVLTGCGNKDVPENTTEQTTEQSTEQTTNAEQNTENSTVSENTTPTQPQQTPPTSLNGVAGSDNQVVTGGEIVGRPPVTNTDPEDANSTDSTVDDNTETDEDVASMQQNLKDVYSFTGPSVLPNDSTHLGRYSYYYNSASQESIALKYYIAFFEDEEETHYVINKASLTVGVMTYDGEYINVTIHDYTTGAETGGAEYLTQGEIVGKYKVKRSDGTITSVTDGANTEDTTPETETPGNNQGNVSDNQTSETPENNTGDTTEQPQIDKSWREKVLTYTVDKDLWIIHKTNCPNINIDADMETVRSRLNYLISANELGVCQTCLHENATHGEETWESQVVYYTVDLDTWRIHKHGAACITNEHSNKTVKSSLSYLEQHNILFRCNTCFGDNNQASQ